MSLSLSPNTQAILLLTAPLIVGRGAPSSELLAQGEYKRLAKFLRERQRQPADFLAPDAEELLGECQTVIDGSRLNRLLARGFLLSQAIERWQARAIWLASRADPEYPKRVKARLKDDAPPVLYGCGDAAILGTGGLAVVGSRHVDETLLEYTECIGRLAAESRRSLISGGARGIDQAAMRGALEAGGKAAGVLADSLERAALNRDHRDLLMHGQLVLISPYDPVAGFNVGHAMQRNKLIYALAEAALVVNADYDKGGTWAGAVEQLEKLRLVTIYVRSTGRIEKALEMLQRKGALPWPNPETPEEFAAALAVDVVPEPGATRQNQLAFEILKEPEHAQGISANMVSSHSKPMSQTLESPLTPADDLLSKLRELLENIATFKTDAQVANDLQVPRNQAKKLLQRLVAEGVLEKVQKPLRYRRAAPVKQAGLFQETGTSPSSGDGAWRESDEATD
jgi:predicted Rossmann fold nucleotide-binding protein DprA/Smf involved in DNA uptake